MGSSYRGQSRYNPYARRDSHPPRGPRNDSFPPRGRRNDEHETSSNSPPSSESDHAHRDPAVIYLKHGAMLHAPTGQTYTIRPGGTITFKNSVMLTSNGFVTRIFHKFHVPEGSAPCVVHDRRVVKGKVTVAGELNEIGDLSLVPGFVIHVPAPEPLEHEHIKRITVLKNELRVPAGGILKCPSNSSFTVPDNSLFVLVNPIVLGGPITLTKPVSTPDVLRIGSSITSTFDRVAVDGDVSMPDASAPGPSSSAPGPSPPVRSGLRATGTPPPLAGVILPRALKIKDKILPAGPINVAITNVTLPVGFKFDAFTLFPESFVVPANSILPGGFWLPPGTVVPGGTSFGPGSIIPTGTALPKDTRVPTKVLQFVLGGKE